MSIQFSEGIVSVITSKLLSLVRLYRFILLSFTHFLPISMYSATEFGL